MKGSVVEERGCNAASVHLIKTVGTMTTGIAGNVSKWPIVIVNRTEITELVDVEMLT